MVLRSSRSTPSGITIFTAALLWLSLLGTPPTHAAVLGDTGTCIAQPIVLGLNGEHLALVRSANVGWVRITIRWSEVNPAPQVWRFARYDRLIKTARERGLNVLAILSTAPEWAGGGPLGTRPPLLVGFWETFVRKTAYRYRHQIAAYEVWNEPNLRDSGIVGVGWDRDLDRPPLYVDYLRAAARAIRQTSPGSLVVGPVTSSEPNSRTVEVFRQIEQATFPEGPASSFLDVISFHANARSDDPSREILTHIASHLGTLRNRNPSNLRKPIWITEMGWKSDRVGEASQRDRVAGIIRNLTAEAGGAELDCTSHPFAPFLFTHAFIFHDMDIPGLSSGVFRADKSPKPIVTDYLRPLGFPARQPLDDQGDFQVSCCRKICDFRFDAGPSHRDFCQWDFGDQVTRTGCEITHTFPRKGLHFVAFSFLGQDEVKVVLVE
jgi:hypothetical protein